MIWYEAESSELSPKAPAHNSSRIGLQIPDTTVSTHAHVHAHTQAHNIADYDGTTVSIVSVRRAVC